MNLTALALSRVPFGPGRPAPYGAVITPTRSTDPMSVLARTLDRLIDAWKARQPIDAATLRARSARGCSPPASPACGGRVRDR
jgi:hypothetical protein